MSSCEKFFIGRIALGLENMGFRISQENLELLLGENLNGRDEEFIAKIKNALTNAYSQDVKKFQRKIVTSDPESIWNESADRLSRGRETLLKDIVIGWYPKYKRPGFFEIIGKMLKK